MKKWYDEEYEHKEDEKNARNRTLNPASLE